MTRTATEAINSYLTDMLALEEHIGVAISAQNRALKDEPVVLTSALAEMRITVEAHTRALRRMIEARDAGSGNAIADRIKEAGATLAGLGAAAVDLVRNEKVPKDLRDDYTAFGLATVSYVMLLSTAMALNDDETAALAQRHLRDYTTIVMTLNNILPSAVIALLRQEGLPAHEEKLPAIARALEGAWRDPYHVVPEVDEVSAA